MGKTSVDARRHIREWSAFFSDLRGASAAAVEEFIREHQKQKYLRQSLQRLVARGFVRKHGNVFSATLLGFRLFHRSSVRAKETETRWDGKWRLISFDVPVHENAARNRLRAFLKEFNFFQLHKSVWVCPNALADAFWKLVVEYELDKYCKVMVVEILEGDADLKRHFKIKE
ncbi:MAG: hypothetical protein V1885_02175 [Candidatus Brennerbacteria bacterium]